MTKSLKKNYFEQNLDLSGPYFHHKALKKKYNTVKLHVSVKSSNPEVQLKIKQTKI